MRTRFPLGNVALFALLAATFSSVPAVADEAVCGEYGTSVVFAESPAEAARQALKQEKLVFVLHVSGLFEESEFT